MTIGDVVTVNDIAADAANIVVAVMDINLEVVKAPAAVEQVITGVIVDVIG